MFCSACSAALLSNAVFCGGCGTKVVATSVASTHADASAPGTDDAARAAAAEHAEKAKRSVDAASAMIGSAASTASSVVKQGGAIVGEVGGRIAESAKKMDPKTKKLMGLVVGAVLVLGAVGYGAKLMLVPGPAAVVEKNLRAAAAANVELFRETLTPRANSRVDDSKLSARLNETAENIASSGGIKEINTECEESNANRVNCSGFIKYKNGKRESHKDIELVKINGKWLIKD